MLERSDSFASQLNQAERLGEAYRLQADVNLHPSLPLPNELEQEIREPSVYGQIADVLGQQLDAPMVHVKDSGERVVIAPNIYDFLNGELSDQLFAGFVHELKRHSESKSYRDNFIGDIPPFFYNYLAAFMLPPGYRAQIVDAMERQGGGFDDALNSGVLLWLGGKMSQCVKARTLPARFGLDLIGALHAFDFLTPKQQAEVNLSFKHYNGNDLDIAMTPELYQELGRCMGERYDFSDESDIDIDRFLGAFDYYLGLPESRRLQMGSGFFDACGMQIEETLTPDFIKQYFNELNFYADNFSRFAKHSTAHVIAPFDALRFVERCAPVFSIITRCRLLQKQQALNTELASEDVLLEPPVPVKNF